ncbi:MAG: recombination mediator RecR [Oscillospiraceae bacterium]|jgi:recombination protein RecR|nr:recombination mediator RecR [Oscillospiraceae bacterium]
MKITDGALPSALERLTEQFATLPGVGMKSAQRMAFFMLTQSDEKVRLFADSLLDAKLNVRRCAECQNLTDSDVCPICRNDRRDHSTICVVEGPKELLALERTREYGGVYHVLHGVISPLRRIGPDDITVKELLARIDGSVHEVIMATNPGAEGETTSMYLSRLLRPLGVKVTRLAYGIPVGGNLEFADDATLYRALEGRVEIE